MLLKKTASLKILRSLYVSLPYKHAIFRILRRFVKLPANIYQHLHFLAPIEIQISSGDVSYFRMHHFGALVENELFWCGYGNSWEATSLRLWARLAKRANGIFDIGANTGVFALAAKAVNPSALVVAFEPVPSIADKLRSNIQLNGFDIAVIEQGVSSNCGEAVMYVPLTEHSYSASLDINMLDGSVKLVERRIHVVRIDKFMKEHNLTSLELVKIDTEKHEFDVLVGFGDIVKTLRPTILIEILNRELGQKIEQFFFGLDYEFYEIIERKQVRRVGSLGVSSGNHLLCPKECSLLHGLRDLVTHHEL